MGQYYDIINFDKNEILILSRISAQKLWDYYHYREFDTALMNMLNGNWKGNEIIVLGDYADSAEKGTLTYNMVQFLREKYHLSDISQDWTSDMAEQRGGDLEDLEIVGNYNNFNNLRYAVNHRKKQFIDTAKYPLKNDRVKTPLLLLLTVGNGYGMGDYHGNDENMVGIWAGDSKYITVHSDLPEDDTLKEIIPDFD